LRRLLTIHRKKQSLIFETEERVRKLCEAAFEGIILMEEGTVLHDNETVSRDVQIYPLN